VPIGQSEAIRSFGQIRMLVDVIGVGDVEVVGDGDVFEKSLP
jgi:hypothetical protein